MKSIFEKEIRDEVVGRINSINENSTAKWGKMNLYQMLKHCTLWEEMIQGKTQHKRMFIGRLFGKIALKKVLKDDAPLRHSTPTLSELTIEEKNGNISSQKAKWITGIEEYANFPNTRFVHAFFGEMTKEQVGYLVYKHIDHHLRQFNH